MKNLCPVSLKLFWKGKERMYIDDGAAQVCSGSYGLNMRRDRDSPISQF